MFVLSDGLCVNGTPLVAGLSGRLPPGVPITGGLAGDGSRFLGTWVFAAGQARPRQICAIGFEVGGVTGFPLTITSWSFEDSGAEFIIADPFVDGFADGFED